MEYAVYRNTAKWMRKFEKLEEKRSHFPACINRQVMIIQFCFPVISKSCVICWEGFNVVFRISPVNIFFDIAMYIIRLNIQLM